MKVKSIIWTIICVLAIQAVVFAAGQDKVDLKLRLKAGESHEMKTTQVQDINQTINGQPMKVKQTTEMVMGIECLSVDANKVMDVAITYKSIKMAMDGPMGHIDFQLWSAANFR
ncbi:MAG: hypothetical protein ABR969_07700 [Sedimentisphaerales bacterium]